MSKTIAEFNLGEYDRIVEFFVDTEADDVYFKLNTNLDYFLGNGNFSEDAKKILQEHNKLEKYNIDNNTDTSKLRVRVIVEEVEENAQ